jgi:predicted RNase H-like nuclease (RuvC/YqgF family)
MEEKHRGYYMKNILYDRLYAEYEKILEEREKALSELDIERKRRTVLNCIMQGALNEGENNKYILSDFEETEIKISRYEKEINEYAEKIKALEYQMKYINMVTDNLRNNL